MKKQYKDKHLRLFSLNSNRPLAEDIASEVGIELGEAKIERFEDGEIKINIEESIRGDDVYVIQSTNDPVNDHFMEILIMIDALRRASAGSINVLMPYYGYARQDRKARSREAITAKLVANMLTIAGANRVITMELHAPQIQSFFDIPVDHLSAIALLANYFIDHQLAGEDTVVISPGHAGVTRAREMADLLDSRLAIIDKRTDDDYTQQETYNIVGEVEGAICILYDDLVDTGRTVQKVSETLKEAGAKDIYVCATHPVLSGKAIERINDSHIKKMIVTNTIDISKKEKCDIIEQISVAPILGDAIKRIHEYESIKPLFDKEYVDKLEHQDEVN